ncbi:MAG: hypothetical protein ABEH56_03440 [Salinirussus sp.]
MSERRERDAGTGTPGRETEGDSASGPPFLSIDRSGTEPEFQVDYRALRQRAVELLEEWESADLLDRVRSRTRTVTAVALGVFVLSGLLNESTTGITATVAAAWLAVSGVVAATVGAIALLLRGLRRPGDVADEQGMLALFGISLLAVGGTYYARHPASRAAWRYLVTGPLRGDVYPDTGTSPGRGIGGESRRDAFPLRQYVRVAGGLSAAVVVVHQGWLAVQGRDTALSSLAGSLVGSGSGVASGTTDLGVQFTPLESIGILALVAVLGAVIGALLAVSRG